MPYNKTFKSGATLYYDKNIRLHSIFYHYMHRQNVSAAPHFWAIIKRHKNRLFTAMFLVKDFLRIRQRSKLTFVDTHNRTNRIETFALFLWILMAQPLRFSQERLPWQLGIAARKYRLIYKALQKEKEMRRLQIFRLGMFFYSN